MNSRRTLYRLPVFSIVFVFMAVMSQPIFAQTEKGIELYNSWKFQEADKAFRDALKANPHDVKANFYLGLSILVQEKYSEALDLFLKVKDDQGKAERQSPSTIPSEYALQIALARARLGLKQYDEAWKNLESAKKEGAASPEVYVYRGVYYLQQEKKPQAIEELEKAIQLDENNAYAHYYLGHAYLRSGNPARSVEEFKKFLQLTPLAPEAVKAKALVDALC